MRAGVLAAAVVFAALAGGCGGGEKRGGELSGKVTVNGHPAGVMTLVVTGPDGKTAGGNTNDAGEYRIPDPPVGELKFQFIAPKQPGKTAGVPPKYASPNSGITHTYSGGKDTFNIDLN